MPRCLHTITKKIVICTQPVKHKASEPNTDILQRSTGRESLGSEVALPFLVLRMP